MLFWYGGACWTGGKAAEPGGFYGKWSYKIRWWSVHGHLECLVFTSESVHHMKCIDSKVIGSTYENKASKFKGNKM